jgi:hypothetical protein
VGQIDNFASYVDISAGQDANGGQVVSGVVDSTNGKLLVVTTNAANSNKPSLFSIGLW